MLLSIIVPAYNVEKYLSNCIRSLVTQKGIDYEIIIVNDGSTDKTSFIAKRLSVEYGNIIKVIEQKNKGLGGARNTGVRVATGKYIAFVDSDDYLMNDAFGIIFRKIGFEEFDLLSFGHKKVYDFNPIIDENSKNDIMIKRMDNLEAIKQFFCDNITSYSWDKVYRKSLIVDNNIEFTEKTYFEDMRVSYECVMNSNKVIGVSLKAYRYLQRSNSITKSLTSSHLNDFISEYNKILKNIPNNMEINAKRELEEFKILKYNSILRIINSINEDVYYEYNKLKPKLRLLEITSSNISVKEKIIYILGENKLLFKLIKKVKKRRHNDKCNNSYL